MNNAVHQLTKLILEAMAWVLNTAAALWVWSWTQIATLFGMAWGDLPGWKLAVGIAILTMLAAVLVIVTFGHLLHDFLFNFSGHVIPRLALLLFLLWCPRELDRYSLDWWLTQRSLAKDNGRP